MTVLVTSFAAGPLDEDRLDNLSLWLDQTEFSGFEHVDYRFECSDTAIRCRVPDEVPEARLNMLCELIDDALRRIVKDLGPRTRVQ